MLLLFKWVKYGYGQWSPPFCHKNGKAYEQEKHTRDKDKETSYIYIYI